MKKIWLLTIAALAMAACNNEEKEGEENSEETSQEQTEEKDNKNIALFFGEKFDTTGASVPTELASIIEGKDSVQMKLKARINQTCKKKGCWMTLDMQDESEMRVWFKDYGFFVPKNADGFESIITGYAYVDTVSVEMQKHLLEDARETGKEIAQADIDAITDPKVELGFEATGVMIYMPEAVAKENQKSDTEDEKEASSEGNETAEK